MLRGCAGPAWRRVVVSVIAVVLAAAGLVTTQAVERLRTRRKTAVIMAAVESLTALERTREMTKRFGISLFCQRRERLRLLGELDLSGYGESPDSERRCVMFANAAVDRFRIRLLRVCAALALFAGLLIGPMISPVAAFESACTGTDFTSSCTYTVGADITALAFVVRGGEGGGKASYSQHGGAAGVVTGFLAVTPGQSIGIVVGSAGGYGNSSGGATGGAPGGGSTPAAVSGSGGAGGGYSALQIGGNKVVVAGGGGGSGLWSEGGNGGQPGGDGGSAGSGTDAEGGHGATQSAPGAAATGSGGGGNAGSGLIGGDSNSGTCRYSGGAGGGGYFGGGAGGCTNNSTSAGGGAGSSWADPGVASHIAYSTGSGVGGELELNTVPGPLTFADTAFGDVAVGTAASSVVTVTNTGGAAAVPSSISVAGSNVSIDSDGAPGRCAASAPIGVGSNCTVKVTWSPTATGPLTDAGLTIDYPDGPDSSNQVSLTGTAVSPPAFTSASSATATVNAAMAQVNITTSGSPAANAISEAPAGSQSGLPAGVTFTDNGDGTAKLAGTPTQQGVFLTTLTATNGVNPDATQVFTLTVTASESAALKPPRAAKVISKPSSPTQVITFKPAAHATAATRYTARVRLKGHGKVLLVQRTKDHKFVFTRRQLLVATSKLIRSRGDVAASALVFRVQINAVAGTKSSSPAFVIMYITR